MRRYEARLGKLVKEDRPVVAFSMSCPIRVVAGVLLVSELRLKNGMVVCHNFV
jgi:hypothetical protein